MEQKDTKSLQARYERNKVKLLQNKNICKENRALYKKFLEWQETKLKRINNLPKLDASTIKTLLAYLLKLNNINDWFNNKPLKNISKKDIERVYTGLEEGTITNKFGQPFKSRSDYYNKIFKSKLFKMIGKYEIACQVMEYFSSNGDQEQPDYCTEEQIRKIIDNIVSPHHKALAWLAFDIGENIKSLLMLKVQDISKRKSPITKESEYIVTLNKKILKRSRLPRALPTNYAETCQFLDIVTPDNQANDYLFDFDESNARKFLRKAVRISGVKTNLGKVPTWKHFRKSMTCDLLNKNWSIDEVKDRLGHKPSSRAIDHYANYNAINRNKTKKKVSEFEIVKVKDELKEKDEILEYQDRKIRNLEKKLNVIKKNKDYSDKILSDALKDPKFLKALQKALDKN